MPGANDTAGFSARVVGSVQGVGFRVWTRLEASKLGLTGYVRNLPDRSVEVVASGEAEALTALLDLLKMGPPGASVRSLDLDWLDDPAKAAIKPPVITGFQIRF